MSNGVLYIIDGNSLVHRAFHAIQPLSTSKGLPTNAVFGFTNMLLKIIKEENPAMLAIAFDKGKITFRHADFGDYKAQRKPTPEELRIQFPLVKEVLSALRVKVLELEGYEADDLIGTLSAQAEKEGLSSVIITGDRDALQLVSPLTRVRLTKKGISELEEYDEKKVVSRFGIPPEKFTDFKGLVGDPSDNVPGIPGVGEKTASRLINKYGCLEDIISKAGEIGGRLGEQLRAYAQDALLAKKLVTVCRQAPLDVRLKDCRWEGPDYNSLLEVFNKLEFRSLIKSIFSGREQSKGAGGAAESRPAAPASRCIALSPANTEDFLAAGRKSGGAAVDISFGPKGEVESFAVCCGEEGMVYTAAMDSGPGEGSECTARALSLLFSDKNIKKYCHNSKEIYRKLGKQGVKIENLAFDTMIAAYLVNPASPNRSLEDVCLEHLGTLPAGKDPAGRARLIFRLVSILAQKLKMQEQEQLFCDVEMPLAPILAEMEEEGVAVDKEGLAAMSAELGAQLEALAREIYRLAGCTFNLNSPRQLGKVLFEDLKLPVIKKTKTGYSTDASVLEELAGSHEIVAKILEYRQLAKLKSTYTDGLAALIDPVTGMLHTTFQQTVTATGRLSSTEPNLQNIPIKLEAGRLIRKVFVPRAPGRLLLTADYSQIELRVLAHLSGDPVLVSAFKNGEDIHIRTAAEVFGVKPHEVTPEMRSKAKAVNFGIIYGLSDYGLARDIKVGRQEARRYIESYFKQYAGVKAFIDGLINKARENGYVTTVLKRRRYLPDLFSPNHSVRAAAERMAVNTPIQGSAADIIKLAMISIRRELAAAGLKAKLILQVHDELIFDAPEGEINRLAALVKECMENAFPLDVPLVVEVKAGPNWYDVKKIQLANRDRG